MALKSTQKIGLGTFDFIKGYAMISIIIGHLMNLHNVGQSVVLTGIGYIISVTSAGLIPVFFIISGFGFKGKSWKVMLKKTFSDLLIPYLIVILAISVIKPIVLILTTGSLHEAVSQTLPMTISLLLGNTGERYLWGRLMPWWLPSWYILASFISFNVLNVILKLKRVQYQILAVLGSMAFGYLLFYLDFHLFCISQGTMAVGFCYLGCMIKKYRLLDEIRIHRWVYVLLVLIFVAEFRWGCFDLCPGKFNNVVLDCIGVCCTGLLLMSVGVWLGNKEWAALEWIKKIGVYTYWLICIHTVEDNCIPWYKISYQLPDHQLLSFMIILASKTVLLIVACMILKEYSKYSYRKKLEKNRSK